MKNVNRNMLHMKLNSAVSVFAVAAAFAVFLPPSNALAGVCFLPDCMDDEVVQGDINMNINSDTEYCEEKGYTYYSSGECPQYQAKVGTCSRDDHYLKCDAVTWCKNNGYNTQTCSLPSFVNDQCPNGKPYYKGCKEDRPRACREQGYVNSCSPGRLYKSTNRCPWDNSYGKCCTASPSAGCPTNYKVTCDSSRGSSGTDTCGYTCYRCCSDACPSGTSKNYSGTTASYTECGTACKRCKGCPSGTSTSHITEHFLRLPNVGLVTDAVIHVLPDQKALVAEADMNLTVAVRLNAEAPVTPAASIPTPTPARAGISPVLADQVTQLPAQDLDLVLAVQLPVPAINVLKILIPAVEITIIPEIPGRQLRLIRGSMCIRIVSKVVWYVGIV